MSEFTMSVTIDLRPPDISAKAADPLMREIAEKISNDSKRNIRNRVSPDGTRIQKLARHTKANKRSMGSSTPNHPLINTGKMLNAIKVFKDKRASYSVGVDAVGSPRRDLIALIHHTEGVNQFTQVVRQFIGISAAREKWIEARITRWLSSQTKKTRTPRKRTFTS